MSRWFAVVGAALLCAATSQANGLLIPKDTSIPPLALVSHDVEVQIVEQVATTKVTQVFRNHTDRALEATFIFPVPKGASVHSFAMWIEGKEVKGEMIEAGKAKQIYTDIVRRMQDPGLLEYVGQNLLQLSVYPVPARGDQKLTLSFTGVCPAEGGLVEYTYPLKTTNKAPEGNTKFTINAEVNSEHSIHSIYSPTHSVNVKQPKDREAKVKFESSEAKLDKDFQLYYSLSSKDVGLTAMTYRPKGNKDGTFLMLISPRAQLASKQKVSRDVVFVVDTSGSMSAVKMEQARKAVKYCIDQLEDGDRFNVLNFATVVNHYSNELVKATAENRKAASKWVEELQASGGTAIDSALTEALAQRGNDKHRNFNVVFFTDGMPTVGETNPETIIKRVKEKNSANTRIFTFGVGDDVNAAMLDKLAEETRSVSTYVRPEEDIEAKVSGMYGKVSHPVLTDLKLSASNGVQLTELYPGKLPDLFHGGQLTVVGKYRGKGHAALTLTGMVGSHKQEFVYELNFPEETGDERAFVENLWARRKVGYLLEQIRDSGSQKELIEEVVSLAKKHGITTPYTSYLVVPDNVPVLAQNTPVQPVTMPVPTPTPMPNYRGMQPQPDNSASPYYSVPVPVQAQAPPGVQPTYSPQVQPAMTSTAIDPQMIGDMALGAQGQLAQNQIMTMPSGSGTGGNPGYKVTENESPRPTTQYQFHGSSGSSVPGPKSASPGEKRKLDTLSEGEKTGLPATSTAPLPTSGKSGVDLALQLKKLHSDDRASGNDCKAAGRTCRQLDGVWLDTGYEAKMTTVKVKSMGKAYFRLLEKHPELKEVFKLGQHVVWVTPSGKALVISPDEGCDKMNDKEIEALFATK